MKKTEKHSFQNVMNLWWYKVCIVHGRVATASLNCKNPQSSSQNLLSIFNNSFLLRLFKLTAASPLTNSCPTQKQKDSEWRRSLFLCSFLPAHICIHIFTLRSFTWLPAWRYVTICDISSLRTAMFFPVKKINLAYMLTFALRWVAIFIPIFTNALKHFGFDKPSSGL